MMSKKENIFFSNFFIELAKLFFKIKKYSQNIVKFFDLFDNLIIFKYSYI